MKIKSFAIAALAATVGFTACSKDENGGGGGVTLPDGETKVLQLKLSKGAVSKAEVGPVADGTDVTFNDGYIFFTLAGGEIVKVTQITNDAAAVDADGNSVGIQKLTSNAGKGGAQIPGVPALAKYVYIAGNLPSGVTVPGVGSNISSVKDLAVSLKSQFSDDFGMSKVTLWSGDPRVTTGGDKLGEISNENDGTDDYLYAFVEVSAVSSRIEISSVLYDNGDDTDVVTKFQVDGIYVNNYYESMTLGGAAGDLTNNGSDNAETIYTENSTAYTDLSEYLYDADETNGVGTFTATPAKVAPAAGKVWGYTVVAPAKATEVPHVIIRLSDVESTLDGANPAFDGIQWLTVKNFIDLDTNEALAKLEPGVIYTISAVKFDESHLTEAPEMLDVEVYVEASLIPWTTKEVGAGF